MWSDQKRGKKTYSRSPVGDEQFVGESHRQKMARIVPTTGCKEAKIGTTVPNGISSSNSLSYGVCSNKEMLTWVIK